MRFLTVKGRGKKVVKVKDIEELFSSDSEDEEEEAK